ncbi:hypothetical protein K1719_015077 [Acacia pycnantha]|nr:hypothetical protein K1719_015077 [Acacia pycnantha]
MLADDQKSQKMHPTAAEVRKPGASEWCPGHRLHHNITGRYEFMTILPGYLDSPRLTLATEGIVIQTTSPMYTLPTALSASVSTGVGNELGAGKGVAVHDGGHRIGNGELNGGAAVDHGGERNMGKSVHK